jgi:hypothetical protein
MLFLSYPPQPDYTGKSDEEKIRLFNQHIDDLNSVAKSNLRRIDLCMRIGTISLIAFVVLVLAFLVWPGRW